MRTNDFCNFCEDVDAARVFLHDLARNRSIEFSPIEWHFVCHATCAFPEGKSQNLGGLIAPYGFQSIPRLEESRQLFGDGLDGREIGYILIVTACR